MTKFSLNDLKKMGSDLLETAKSANIGGMVDKVKTGIESTMKPKTPNPGSPHAALVNIYADLNEIIELQMRLNEVVKSLKNQITHLENELAKPNPDNNQTPPNSNEVL